jgi:hypothetical protein
VARRVTSPGPPSSRLIGLIEGDLSGYRREAGDEGWVRFVPAGGGPVFELASRIEKRFLGRTEIAVFRADFDVSLPEESIIALRHTGGLKRTGVTAVLVEGGESGQRIAAALATDRMLAEAVMPLDFTRFDVVCGPAGCWAEVELMGASHVAIALPPIRSYVHLYPDQREAMERGFESVRRVVLDSH